MRCERLRRRLPTLRITLHYLRSSFNDTTASSQAQVSLKSAVVAKYVSSDFFAVDFLLLWLTVRL